MSDPKTAENGTGRDRANFNANDQRLNLDAILTTQPELGPSIPDGGYGWLVFLATLFFHMLIPSLIVSFGIFLAFSMLENATPDDYHLKLWDETLLHVPLFFMISSTFFDPFSRQLITNSTWPRLVGTAGTCLICAGLLFVWMGRSAAVSTTNLFNAMAGIFSGLGASLQMAQCEILMSQYFRMKLPILNQIAKVFTAIGFMIAPIVLGHNIIKTSLVNVILWYQAVLLQGLVVNIMFKKPAYMKSKQKAYQFVSQLSSPDDEEDIFSKNSRELQIKRQTSTETHVTRIELPQAGPSSSSEVHIEQQNWEKFDDEDEEVKYDKLNGWETFDDEEAGEIRPKKNLSPINTSPLSEELSEMGEVPSPLFSDLPVNNNTTYAYDDEIRAETRNSNVFMPNAPQHREYGIWQHLDLLKEPTFYKSLSMVITNKFSLFVFYSLFPAYLYMEVEHITISHVTLLVAALSLITLVFLAGSYWLNVGKAKRPVCFWILCWVGTFGYFMLSDFTNERVLLAGAVQVVLSMNCLQHIGEGLMGVTVRGEVSKEYSMLSILSSIAMFLFLVIKISFKDCFRIMAVLHFFVGTLWLANFVYKRLRIS